VTTPAVGDSRFAIREAGDSGLLLEFEAVIDPVVNARAVAVARTIATQRAAGVRDVVPTYRSVAVHFDPMLTDVDSLRASMQRAASSAAIVQGGELIEVPVVYGGDDGPDLEEVGAFAGLTAAKVAEEHCAREYRVFMLGFLPGFAYMGSVDERIAAPRKATPRARIPAGSVGIAGRQTGIYPRQSPGGWQIIGRTALEVFDPSREQPSLFAPGDRVRFVPQARGPERPNRQMSEPANLPTVEAPKPRTTRALTVLRPGLLTTIQDRGRFGRQDRGVPVAGPMDWYSHWLANALVGNQPGAGVLEATLLGPELRFEQPATIAVAGADLGASVDGFPLSLNSTRACPAGSVLRFGERLAGARAYIAVDGGVDVPPMLGSCATHVISGLGGIDGRALRAGDRIALGSPCQFASSLPLERFRFASAGARLRVMRGPQDDHFDESACDILERTRFTISPQSNRMGYRLVGSERTRSVLAGSGGPGPVAPGAMISDATFTGGLQITPAGDPILLMADRQTTGGYPQIATVITADLPIAGQLAPGDWIEFTLCTRADAITALKELLNGA
jgi:KipI family sensor histidine kinase inhibitor